MAPLSKAPTTNVVSYESTPWVPVTWMPHTSISQTCYVRVSVRAAFYRSTDDNITSITAAAAAAATSTSPGEWKVRATVHGMAGTPLGLATETPAATLRHLTEWKRDDRDVVLMDGGCTHGCVWEETIRLPIRWRDLPRDAYLQLEVIGPMNELVRRTFHGQISDSSLYHISDNVDP